jgi:hypothetical protein
MVTGLKGGCVVDKRIPILSASDERINDLRHMIIDLKDDNRQLASRLEGKMDTIHEILQSNQAELIMLKNNIETINQWKENHIEWHKEFENKQKQKKKTIVTLVITLATTALSAVIYTIVQIFTKSELNQK